MKRHHARLYGRRGSAFVLVAIVVPALIGLLATAGGAAAASRTIAVTLTAEGSVEQQPGGTVVLLAKARRLPPGDDVLIRGRRPGRTSTFKVKECRSSTCFASWKQRSAGRVAFQALVVRRNRVTAVLGASRLIHVVWRATATPPPPPPPSGPPEPGHYGGTTVQSTTISFDVASDSTAVSNVQIGRVLDTCEPQAHSYGGPWTIAGPIPINPDRTFSATVSTADGGSGSISGSFDGAGGATGSFKFDLPPISAFGRTYQCTSGTISFTAKQGGTGPW